MAEVTTRLLKNVNGMLEEFFESYPVWDRLTELERMTFDTEWCNAVAQYEALQDAVPAGEKHQLETITRRLNEIKPQLIELNLLLPKGI
jgi:hypothetical protein